MSWIVIRENIVIELIHGDCIEKMRELPENSVDSIVTDPPYELGFMGKSWDNTGIANNPEMWREAMRVLKPGGHLLAFSGTRTYHRMAVAIEDAGFEVRDMIEWVYGSGFPKSLNIGKAVDKLQGNEREVVGEKPTLHHGTKDNVQKYGFATEGNIELTKGTSEWEGWGTALKPAHEPICMARKPLAEKTVAENVLKYGTGGIDIDQSRVESSEDMSNIKAFGSMPENKSDEKGFSRPWMNDKQSILDKQNAAIEKMKSLGRFPANLIHDNSEEVRECFPETKSGKAVVGTGKGFAENPSSYSSPGQIASCYADEGNASRFFKSIIYQAKASKSERNKGCEGLEEKIRDGQDGNFVGGDNRVNGSGELAKPTYHQNNHPTVKPIALMSYLIKMVTPKGGTVLDPFMGSGSTGVAAKQNGYGFIGIDMTAEYIVIAKKRIYDNE